MTGYKPGDLLEMTRRDAPGDFVESWIERGEHVIFLASSDDITWDKKTIEVLTPYGVGWVWRDHTRKVSE